MDLITYRPPSGGPRTGVLAGDAVIDVADALGPDARGFADMRTLLLAGPSALGRLSSAIDGAGAEAAIPLADVELLAPILDPPRIFAIGRNYAEHAAEGRAEIPEFPMLFFKPASTLIGPAAEIIVPPSTERVDWEGELAVVIGTPGKRIATADALTYVAGYAVANDVTARDWQRRTSQFDAGKMFDTFCPLGPSIVTADVVEPQDLEITTTVNGILMQSGRTADMIFPVTELISYLSQAVQLLPGDVILTGTPAGVGYARSTPIFLFPGDVVSVTISGLGTLTNPVVAETLD